MTMKNLVARENDQSFKQDLITTHDILLKNLFSLQLKTCAIDPLWTNPLLILHICRFNHFSSFQP